MDAAEFTAMGSAAEEDRLASGGQLITIKYKGLEL